MPTIKVLIADDHPIIRQGVRVLLSTEPDLEIVGECDDGRKAVELAGQTKPDVVLMDVAMPFLNGATATRRILRLHPRCRVLALSTYTDDEAVKRMLLAGAAGYLSKQSAADELVQAVRQVSAGMSCFSQSVTATAMRVRDPGSDKAARNRDLNQRERQVVKLIAEGLSNKEIAQRLELHLSQMKYCRERIMDKLKMRNVADVTRFALAKGWVTLLKEKPALTPVKPQVLPTRSFEPLPAALAAEPPVPPTPDHRVAA